MSLYEFLKNEYEAAGASLLAPRAATYHVIDNAGTAWDVPDTLLAILSTLTMEWDDDDMYWMAPIA